MAVHQFGRNELRHYPCRQDAHEREMLKPLGRGAMHRPRDRPPFVTRFTKSCPTAAGPAANGTPALTKSQLGFSPGPKNEQRGRQRAPGDPRHATEATTVASFRTWRGSQLLAAQSPEPNQPSYHFSLRLPTNARTVKSVVNNCTSIALSGYASLNAGGAIGGVRFAPKVPPHPVGRAAGFRDPGDHCGSAVRLAGQSRRRSDGADLF